MTELRKQNLAKDAAKDQDFAAMLRKLESLEIKDGKIILKVRARPSGAASSKDNGQEGDTRRGRAIQDATIPERRAAAEGSARAGSRPGNTQEGLITRRPPARDGRTAGGRLHLVTGTRLTMKQLSTITAGDFDKN